MRATSKTISALTCAVVAVGVALPAQADVRRFSDSHRDIKAGHDIWSVRVDNSTRVRSQVRVRVQQDNVRSGDGVTIYLDTRGGHPGPEYAFFGAAGSEYVLHRMRGWQTTGRMVRPDCGYRMRINESTDVTSAVLPRGCVGDPGKVRVAVLASRTDGGPTDWAKARRTFLDFVRR